MLEYGSILMFGAMATGVVLLMFGVIWASNRWLNVSHPSAIKEQPFECGKDPIALPAGRMPIHFYVVAMLFVVFDVEVVFLFPWGVLVRELGWFGIAEMGVFLAIVVAGFAYAWKQGALVFK